MEERLEREERIVQGPDKLFQAAQAIAYTEELESVETESLEPEIKALITRCMEGTEPVDVPLKPWQNQRFNATNVTVVLLRAAGLKGSQIAEMLGQDQARVSVILTHPYGKKILQAMMHRQGARIVDIKTRLEDYAGAILDKMHEEAMKSEDLKIVAAVGFGLLDRAGYGTVQKIQSESRSLSVTASPENISALTDALNGSDRVDRHVMPNFKVKPPPSDGGRSVGSTEVPLALGAGGQTVPTRRQEPGDGDA
jgi:hypothetical protein